MDEELRSELFRRMEKDQVARKAMDHEGMREADGENLPWLRAVIAEHGWPGASLVGKDGANAAWLLVQPAAYRHLSGMRPGDDGDVQPLTVARRQEAHRAHEDLL